MVESVNTALFLALNASASPNPALVGLTRFLAVATVWLAAAILAGLWVWGARGRRGALLATGLGLAVGMTLAWTIASLWYHPRPADLGLGHVLLFHEPETSFPSDHATFVWAIGFGLLATGAARGWGWLIVGLGLATAWARVYLGVHFPLDMAGALGVALVAAGTARLAQPRLTAHLLPLVEPIYEGTLRASRLSPSLFPRRERR